MDEQMCASTSHLLIMCDFVQITSAVIVDFCTTRWACGAKVKDNFLGCTGWSIRLNVLTLLWSFRYFLKVRHSSIYSVFQNVVKQLSLYCSHGWRLRARVTTNLRQMAEIYLNSRGAKSQRRDKLVWNRAGQSPRTLEYCFSPFVWSN